MYNEKIQTIFDIAKKNPVAGPDFRFPMLLRVSLKKHLWDDSALSGFEAINQWS